MLILHLLFLRFIARFAEMSLSGGVGRPLPTGVSAANVMNTGEGDFGNQD